MRLSVTVPDDVWERAQLQLPGAKDSHLVQEALRRFGGDGPHAGYARSSEVETTYQKARAHLAEGARKEFELGYGAAAICAQALPLWLVERLVTDFRYDVKAWAGSYAQGVVAEEMLGVDSPEAKQIIPELLRYLGRFVSTYGDDFPSPRPIFVRGFVAAMRDLWTDVSRDTDALFTEPDAEERTHDEQ